MAAKKGPRPPASDTPNGSLLFRISEVSRMLGISASALRQWENAGLTYPMRTSGGYRTYSYDQVNRLKHIHHLRVDKGLNIEAIRQLLGKDAKKAQIPAKPHPIGPKLRQLRRERKMTLAQAAAGTNLSPSFVSSLERGQVHASISTLQKLSVLYKSSVLALFNSGAGQPGHSLTKLVRPGERKKISNEPGIDIELLAFGDVAMEAHIFRLAPNASSGGSYHHEGEEFIFMMSGAFEIWLDEVEHHLLNAGDCLYFSSSQTHRWSVSGTAEATLLWVNTPPTF